MLYAISVPQVLLAAPRRRRDSSPFPEKERIGRSAIYDKENPMWDILLYEILEVSPTARPAVIRAAYRCLVQEYHPDRNPGKPDAGVRMSLINHAYSVLSDPLQRARYDQTIGIGGIERRGGKHASNPGRAHAGGGGNPRPFAFRPLD